MHYTFRTNHANKNKNSRVRTNPSSPLHPCIVAQQYLPVFEYQERSVGQRSKDKRRAPLEKKTKKKTDLQPDAFFHDQRVSLDARAQLPRLGGIKPRRGGEGASTTKKVHTQTCVRSSFVVPSAFALQRHVLHDKSMPKEQRIRTTVTFHLGRL